jgi:hypothetical protein
MNQFFAQTEPELPPLRVQPKPCGGLAVSWTEQEGENWRVMRAWLPSPSSLPALVSLYTKGQLGGLPATSQAVTSGTSGSATTALPQADLEQSALAAAIIRWESAGGRVKQLPRAGGELRRASAANQLSEAEVFASLDAWLAGESREATPTQPEEEPAHAS